MRFREDFRMLKRLAHSRFLCVVIVVACLFGGINAWGQVSSDPALRAIEESNPSTAIDLVRSADLALRLGDTEMAGRFLSRVVADPPGDREFTDMVDELGSVAFARLSNSPTLAADGGRLAQMAFAAHQRVHSNPTNLRNWIAELSSDDARVRMTALDHLKRSGGAAVGPLVGVLADSTRVNQHALARSVLARMGDDARLPLLAILDQGSPEEAAAALSALAPLLKNSDVVFLLRPALAEGEDPAFQAAAATLLQQFGVDLPEPRSAAARLIQETERCFRAERLIQNQADGEAIIWTYDSASKTASENSVSIDAHYRQMAAQFASDAYRILPGHAETIRLYLLTLLEEASYAVGLDTPLPLELDSAAQIAADLGTDAVLATLIRALELERPVPAQAAARVLGQIGDADGLIYGGSDPTPLIQAVNNPDRRVRWAALEAIMSLGPESAYPGSSDVVEMLMHMIASTGDRNVVIASNNNGEVNRLGGTLMPLGYEFLSAYEGRTAMEVATSSSDVELILIDARIQNPPIDVLVRHLRLEPRTAGIPALIFAPGTIYDATISLIEFDPLSIVLPTPHSDKDAAWCVEQAEALLLVEQPSADLRFQQAAQAIVWLGELYETDAQNIRQSWQDVESVATDAFYMPMLRESALNILTKIGTSDTQTLLLNYASRLGAPMADRRLAFQTLIDNVEAGGMRLTNEQLLHQYDRYNASRLEDEATQQLLSDILDWIELNMEEKP
jgi:hypothetical protein